MGEGVRRDVASPNPGIKDTPRRAHDPVGPRELAWPISYRVNFLQCEIKAIDMSRGQLSRLHLADRNIFELVLVQRF
jgi:hypothetical protein